MRITAKGWRFLAISLFSLLIVVLAIGLNCHGRRTNKISRCVFNLRNIDLAKRLWEEDNNKTSNDIPTWNGLLPYMPEWSNQIPVCPSGGTYTIGRIGELPTCSIGGPGHSLQPGMK
jgi:hypothetical protein